MRYAFLATPFEGGVYSVYRNLRAGMAARGDELRWVGARRPDDAHLDDPKWDHERRHGELVGAANDPDPKRAAALLRHLETGGYGVVFVNVLMHRLEMNLVRYLARGVRRVLVVHSITPGTYAAARALRDHADAAVGVSPRVRDDLVAAGFPAETTVAIPNGIDLSRYSHLDRGRDDSARPGAAALAAPGRLNVLSLGRVEEVSKGVFWLPQILSHARAGTPPADVRLTVAGDGPDLPELRSRVRAAGLDDCVTFLGSVPQGDVPALVARHDVLLMPSRFEGFGYTLVEAMAGGCVPVASRVRGSTDFIVDDGRTGFLFPVGDVRAAADVLRAAGTDRSRLATMSQAARASATERFGADRMAAAYLDLVRDALARPSRTAEPLSMDRWAYPPGFGAGLRRFVPGWAKNVLRAWRERSR